MTRWIGLLLFFVTILSAKTVGIVSLVSGVLQNDRILKRQLFVHDRNETSQKLDASDLESYMQNRIPNIGKAATLCFSGFELGQSRDTLFERARGIALQAAEAYLERAYRQNLLKLADENIRLQEEVYDRISDLYEKDRIDQEEMERAATLFMESHVDYIAAKKRLDRIESRLKTLWPKVSSESESLESIGLFLPVFSDIRIAKELAVRHARRCDVSKYEVVSRLSELWQEMKSSQKAMELHLKSQWQAIERLRETVEGYRRRGERPSDLMVARSWLVEMRKKSLTGLYEYLVFKLRLLDATGFLIPVLTDRLESYLSWLGVKRNRTFSSAGDTVLAVWSERFERLSHPACANLLPESLREPVDGFLVDATVSDDTDEDLITAAGVEAPDPKKSSEDENLQEEVEVFQFMTTLKKYRKSAWRRKKDYMKFGMAYCYLKESQDSVHLYLRCVPREDPDTIRARLRKRRVDFLMTREKEAVLRQKRPAFLTDDSTQ